MPSKLPIRYGSVSVDCILQNGKTVRTGFSDFMIYLLIAKGRPFITAEFNSGNPHIRPRQFKDEKAGTIANSGGRYVVHNLDAYSFARAHMLLRGVPKGCIDEVVNNLMDKVASKLNSREAMLQFYAVMEIPPPEGFDDFYPAQPMPQQPL